MTKKDLKRLDSAKCSYIHYLTVNREKERAVLHVVKVETIEPGREAERTNERTLVSI